MATGVYKRPKGYLPKSAFKKGMKLSEAHKRNISLACRGKEKSEEHRKNISKGRQGIKFSEEHLKNMSESQCNSCHGKLRGINNGR